MDSFVSLRVLALGIATAGIGSGCSAAGDPPAGDPSAGQASTESNVGVVNQAVYVSGGWGPSAYRSGRNTTISRNPTLSPYEWDDGGNASATTARVCHATSGYTFPAPASPAPSNCSYGVSLPSGWLAGQIKAIAIAQNTSHVYTVFYDSSANYTEVWEGTSTNLGYYGIASSSDYNYWPPTAWFQAPLSVADLIDVDVSPNGEMYYYWFYNGGVARSIGNSWCPDCTSGHLDSVSYRNLNILGISFNASTTHIETWYADGTVDDSSDSLNLNQ